METQLVFCAAGQWVRILSIPAGILRAQFIRFGILEGVRVQCVERLPGGTVVLRNHRQHLAIGHRLASQICVLILGHRS